MASTASVLESLNHFCQHSQSPACLPLGLQAHIWSPETGTTMYVASCESAVHAAMAYDIMALTTRGAEAHTNFDTAVYDPVLALLQDSRLSQVSNH
jgi:hypothetical protein